MGFGKGKGFTGMLKSQKVEKTETVITATSVITGGGGKVEKTETVITATVVLALGSYP